MFLYVMKMLLFMVWCPVIIIYILSIQFGDESKKVVALLIRTGNLLNS